MRLGYPVSRPEGFLLCAKDGSQKWVGDTAAPIKNNNGEIIGSVLVFHDIASCQRAQAELQQINQTHRTVSVEFNLPTPGAICSVTAGDRLIPIS